MNDTPVIDVLAIGELNPDLILSGFADAGPVLGTEQVFENETLTLGSSTAIAAVLMGRLGLRTRLIAMVGDDDHGRFCRDALAAEGVDHTQVVTHPTLATGITISASYPGDRLLMTRYGTIAALTESDIPHDAFSGVRHLHMGSVFLQAGLRPGMARLFERAKAAGLSTSLDCGWDPSGKWEKTDLMAALPFVDTFLPNETESLHLTGLPAPQCAAQRLQEWGANDVVVKCGSDGAHFFSGGGASHMPAFPITPRDTTGAGDAFNAGYVVAMLAGLPGGQRLIMANACGALAASAQGGTGGPASASEASALAARHGHHLLQWQ